MGIATQELGDLWVMKYERGYDRKPVSIDYDSYFKCLLICAKGSGTLAPAERDWIVGFAAACGGSDELVEELKTYPATEEVRHVLNESTATFAEFGNWARTLIYDSIRACYADGELDGGERNTIFAMAAELDVPSQMVAQLEELYLDEQRLRARRLNTLFPGLRPYANGSARTHTSDAIRD
jgi:hypothetical protein